MAIKEKAQVEISMTKYHSDIGKCLRIAQAKFDVKSADLAKGLDTVPQQVVRWRGAKNIRVHQLQDIVAFFGIGMDEFLSLDR